MANSKFYTEPQTTPDIDTIFEFNRNALLAILKQNQTILEANNRILAIIDPPTVRVATGEVKVDAGI